jgi:hypothetical protein
MQNNWDVFLGEVALHYNTTVNAATGYSPYYVMFGRESMMPTEDHLREFKKIYPINAPQVNLYVRQLEVVLSALWEMVTSQLAKNTAKLQIRNEDSARKMIPFSPGDYVFHREVVQRSYVNDAEKKKVKVARKLLMRYTGPHRVIRNINDVIYHIDMWGKERTCHAINLKSAKHYQDFPKKLVDGRWIVNHLAGKNLHNIKDHVILPYSHEFTNHISEEDLILRTDQAEVKEDIMLALNYICDVVISHIYEDTDMVHEYE